MVIHGVWADKKIALCGPLAETHCATFARIYDSRGVCVCVFHSGGEPVVLKLFSKGTLLDKTEKAK